MLKSIISDTVFFFLVCSSSSSGGGGGGGSIALLCQTENTHAGAPNLRHVPVLASCGLRGDFDFGAVCIICLSILYASPLIFFLHFFLYFSPPLLIFFF